MTTIQEIDRLTVYVWKKKMGIEKKKNYVDSFYFSG